MAGAGKICGATHCFLEARAHASSKIEGTIQPISEGLAFVDFCATRAGVCGELGVSRAPDARSKGASSCDMLACFRERSGALHLRSRTELARALRWLRAFERLHAASWRPRRC